MPDHSPKFASTGEFDDYLDSLGLFHMDLTLGRIESCLSRLGLGNLPYPAVQAVGTNGKGTTSGLIARIATAHGLRAGLYTSPHFLHPRERIRIFEPGLPDEHGDDSLLTPNQQQSDCISAKAWLDAANAVYREQEDAPLTYFEYLTAMAVLIFREAGVDLAVFEAGLGGRNDATTALRCPMVCFARIGLDHTQILGDSLEAVAADKAAAMPERGTALTIRQDEAARFILDREAIRKRARLLEVRSPEGMAPVHVPGAPGDAVYPEDALKALPPMLRENGRLAIAAWAHLASVHGWGFEPEVVRNAVGRHVLPGRFQHVFDQGDWLLLDAAHNPQAMQALSRSMREREISPRAMVFACLADKDLRTMAAELASVTRGPVHVPELPGVSRAMPAREICNVLQAAGIHAVAHEGTAAALAAACAEPGSREDASRPVLVCGSLYLLAAFFTLRPNLLGSVHCGES